MNQTGDHGKTCRVIVFQSGVRRNQILIAGTEGTFGLGLHLNIPHHNFGPGRGGSPGTGNCDRVNCGCIRCHADSAVCVHGADIRFQRAGVRVS